LTKVERLILCGDEQQLPPIGVGSVKNIVDKLRGMLEVYHAHGERSADSRK
jgi:hypothetical protein